MADVQRLSELQLVPVVEVTAWRFSDRETPQGPSRDHRADWHQYWLACLEDVGIIGLEPLVPGSLHVATAAFTDLAALDSVLRKLQEPDALADPETASALAGGVALVSGGTVLVEPNCCGDLKDWCEWQAAADCVAPDWKTLWIGHPWLSVRAEGSDLVLSDPHESESPEPRWVFDRGLVLPAVEIAVRELEVFADRLTVVLLGTNPQDGSQVRAVARHLAGLSPLSEGDSEAS